MEILILLADVHPGEEESLRATLAEIEADHAGNGYFRPTESPHTHFVRFVLVHDEKAPPRLLVVANYDGRFGDYLRELETAGPGLGRVFGACDGWDGDLDAFVRRHCYKPRGVYIAFPGRTVADINGAIAIREAIEGFLDLPDVAAYLNEPGVGPMLERLALVPDSTTGGQVAAACRAIAGNASGAAHGFALRQFLVFAKWFSELGQAKTWPLVHGGFDVAAGNLRDREQAIQTVEIGAGLIQNQMTTVTEIRPDRRARLNLALAGTTFLARFGWPPGEFADVGTLHWFAWAVVDGGKRLVFVSAFDGSWQNYMQDFINKLVWGLDALYSNTYDYPDAGMKDIAAFTDYILAHQYPPDVFYSAYPAETVVNVIRDRQITAALGLKTRQPVFEQWLQRL